MPYNHEVRMAGAQLYLHNVQFDDSGTYRCEAVNSKGKDFHYGNVSVQGKKCVSRFVMVQAIVLVQFNTF